jgi:hypothetical protein
MSQFLPDPLSKEEFAVLKQIGTAATIRTVPPRIQERLKLLGYATEVLGGLVVTDEGFLRIAMGRKK